MTCYQSIRSINFRPFLLRLSTRRALAYIGFLCIVLCLLFNAAIRDWRFDDNLEPVDLLGHRRGIEQERKNGVDVKKSGTSPGWRLVDETRAAIAAAGGEPSTSLTPKARKAWDAANPCAGRPHLFRLWTQPKERHSATNTTTTRQGSEPSTLLQVLFEEYANLHRTCTHGGDMEYVTELFNSGDESSTPCNFSVVEFGTHGVGNRLLWLVSVYQFSLLSKRVLLIDSRSTLHGLLCEPFPGSSWSLPGRFQYSSILRWSPPKEFQRDWDNWESSGEETTESTSLNAGTLDKDELNFLHAEDIASEKRDTMTRIQAAIRSKESGQRLSNVDVQTIQGAWRSTLAEESVSENSLPLRQPHFHHVQANEGWAPHSRFFCDNEHQRLHRAKWLNFINGCLYFLPDLFAIPSFQPILEDLFPSRDPLTHLLRQLTLPVDSIWEKVREVYIKDFSAASKLVGMQVRYRDGVGMYMHLNELVNDRIRRCGVDHGLIPDPDARSGLSRTEGPLVIFIASLFPGLRKHLEIEYRETLEKKLDRIVSLKLVQLSKIGYQAFDLESDHQAFLEIICLSLVDELLTSPLSTYGQVAQGLGGLTPWLIDFTTEESGPTSRNCVRGQSTDACFQFPISKFTCPYDKDVDGKQMAEVAPYLKPCQDLADGLQLVPP